MMSTIHNNQATNPGLSMISFLLNDRLVHIEDANADTTVLNYLREQQRLTGTKEGCASGDCGACTVVLAESNNGELHYRAINSCVTFLSALHGKQLITVEHLQHKGQLHPVQQAMVDQHGSQCGFCTPGFIMSLFAFYHSEKTAERHAIDTALCGNLCRCTGYRPIIDAAAQACSARTPDQFDDNAPQTVKALNKIQQQAGITGLYLPTSRDELSQLRARVPKARLVAGATDLALEVTQMHKSLDELISLNRVAELNRLEVHEDHLEIGAAVPLTTLQGPLLKYFPQLTELVDRFASTPIRNQATLGGNVANASPIGDMPPVLLALNATIAVDNGEQIRAIPAKEFFTGYRQTQLKPNEWIDAIHLPLLKDRETLTAYKISKRFEDDISAVCAVFCLAVKDGVVESFSSGFGGVAATPTEAPDLPNELVGKPWSDASTMETGHQLLLNAFSPIDDVRASADYRNAMVANLFKRFWFETTQPTIGTRVVVSQETAHA